MKAEQLVLSLLLICLSSGASIAAPDPTVSKKQVKEEAPKPVVLLLKGSPQLKKNGADKLQIRIDNSGWGKSTFGWPTKTVFLEGVKEDIVIWKKPVPIHRAIDVDASNSVSTRGNRLIISSDRVEYHRHPIIQEFSWNGKSIRFLRSSWD